MDETTNELADLIGEFMALALQGESRKELEAQALELGLPYDQLITMSLTQLIVGRFQVLPAAPEGADEP
ncbi:hypothetical protein EP7_000159 [Isosphaeraceae bacterium EP7]